MANFSAADVKKLRELTGAGMMDCKKALDEADGDFDKAVETPPRQGRGQGRQPGPPSARPPPVSSRTPPARPGRAQVRDRLRRQERGLRRRRPADRRRRGRGQGRPTSRRSRRSRWVTRRSARSSTASPVTIGEKIELGQVVYFDGPVVAYMHKRAADLPPAVGVLVEYDGDADAAAGRRDADRRDAPAVPHPRRGPRGRRGGTRRTSPRRPPARRASPSRRSRRSSRVASTASSRTSSCSSSRRSPRTRSPSRPSARRRPTTR